MKERKDNRQKTESRAPDLPDGLALRLDTVLESYLGSDGVLAARNDSVNAEIKDITQQREVLGERLAALQARLFKQFNALDGLLAQFQATSNYLAQQLSALPRSDTLLGGNKN